MISGGISARILVLGAALTLVVAACGGSGGAVKVESSSLPQIPVPVITPLVATVLSPPRPVLGADNRMHLAYELFVTNPTTSVMHITKVETLDASANDSVVNTETGGAIIATLQGTDLDGETKPFVPAITVDLGPAQVTRLFFDLTLGRKAHIPTSLEHRFTFTLTPPGKSASTVVSVSGRTNVIDEKAMIVGPPLQGGRWLVGGGCCFPASYHRTATLPVNGAFHAPERFAIDYVQLNHDNKLFNGPRGDLSSYAYFGAKILSVAKGVVVDIHDGEPEQTPPNFPDNGTAQTAGGNSIVVDLGNNHFAFYAHMQAFTLTVHLGESVKAGQVLGLLGNTGNSDGPHLHFQITDGPSPLASEGLPYVIGSFDSEGTITSDIDTLLAGAAAVIGPASKGHHEKQLPLQNEVIAF